MKKDRFAGKKNTKKALRVMLQAAVLIFLLWQLVTILVLDKGYRTWQQNEVPTGGRGFIALSYFAIQPGAGQGGTAVSQERLQEHLSALKRAGYVTVTQGDIHRFYAHGEPLPERSLFLMFEDGRRESAVYAQHVLEQMRYKASMLSYAERLEERSEQFLSPRDLLELLKNGYWELGTNGYRLSYINAFDRHGNYLGALTPNEYAQVAPFMQRRYNHYLMDYQRDEYDVPLESAEQMRARIAADYGRMQTVYENKLGALPALYAIMHANTGQFGTTERASDENERWLTELFTLHFNRDVYAYNAPDNNRHDLTRMQPRAYWSANHLLMRIRQETGEDFAFDAGNAVQAAQWKILRGAAMHDGETICVTSEPSDVGRARLVGSEGWQNLRVTAELAGNKLGTQAIDLFADETGEHAIAVEICNNELLVYDTYTGTREEPLARVHLDELDGVAYATWEDNRQLAMAAEIVAKQGQTYQQENSKEIARRLMRAKEETTDANYAPYIEEIQPGDPGLRRLEITVEGALLTVLVDDKVAVAQPIARPAQGGSIDLRAAWGEYGKEQRVMADDVYDGVFRALHIVTWPEDAVAEAGETMLDNRLTWQQDALRKVENAWQGLLRWAVVAF